MKRRDFLMTSAGAAGLLIPVLSRAAQPCPPPSSNVSGGTSATTNCAAAAKSYSTNFSGTETPISEGGVWSNVGLDWTQVTKNNGLACGTQTGNGGYDDSYAHLSGFGANHTASGVIHLINGIDGSCTHEAELLMRWADSAHNARGYECNIAFDGSYAQIVRWNGPKGSFSELASGSYRGLKNGDVLKATAIGNVITLYVNNTAVTSVTDSTFSDGNPGMGFFRRACGANTDIGFSSFSASTI